MPLRIYASFIRCAAVAVCAWRGAALFSSYDSAAQTMQTSADGTSIPPATQIVDNTGAVWTIGSNDAILRDGLQAGDGWGTEIVWTRTTICVHGTDSNWWQWTGVGWVNTGPTLVNSAASSPGPSTSPDGATVPTTTTQIIDSTGSTWTIAPNGAILQNGDQAAGGWGSRILWTGGTIYVLGTDSNWWQWTGGGWISFPPALPSGSGGVSPEGTAVPTTASQIVDNSGSVWTIATNGAILQDGMQAASGWGSAILWTSGTIYVYGTDNNWWRWTGSSWSAFGPFAPGTANDASGQVPPPNTQTSSPNPDPFEPSNAPSGYTARVKSPINQMHFTAGQPMRLFADIRDPNEWQCPPGEPPYVCPDARVAWFDNGNAIGTLNTDPGNSDMWELRLPAGLSAGDHRLTCIYTPTAPPTFSGGPPIPCNAPGVLVHVDPPPSHANTITLTADVALSGSASLNWSDATVIGNGYTVTAAPDYQGNVTISNVFLVGLGTFGGYSIDVNTAGTVSIDRTVVEASAPIRITTAGSLTVTNNEFRQNDLVTYVPVNNPDVATILDLTANTPTMPLFQGNNIGGGITRLNGTAAWQVGGVAPSQGNVIIGPRGVLALSAAGSIVQGNYLHHDYLTGWSQGYNLITPLGLPGLLAEHNVIRQASWTVQNFCGEFRYNLVVDESQHDSWRTSCHGASIHHNVFTHLGNHGTGDNGIVWFYQGESGIAFYNNTVHGGGIYAQPIVRLDNGSGLCSYRNNVVASFVGSGPMIASSVSGVVGYADYNAWSAGGAQRYGDGVVMMSPGAHDSSNPVFAGTADTQYQIDEGMVWLRQLSTFDVLRYYRAIFTPAPGSELIDSGDPADGVGVDRGAVGAGLADPNDRFGAP